MRRTSAHRGLSKREISKILRSTGARKAFRVMCSHQFEVWHAQARLEAYTRLPGDLDCMDAALTYACVGVPDSKAPTRAQFKAFLESVSYVWGE